MTRILALDIATNVGWAIDVEHETLDLSPLAHDFGQMSAAFSSWLADMLTEHSPDLVAMERVGFAGPNNYRLCGLLWDAHRVCWLRGIRRVEYTPQQIKKHVTGSAKARKKHVFQAVQKLGWLPRTDHEADAIALLLLARERAEERKAA